MKESPMACKCGCAGSAAVSAALRAGLPPRRRWLARAGHQAGGRACQPRQGCRL